MLLLLLAGVGVLDHPLVFYYPYLWTCVCVLLFTTCIPYTYTHETDKIAKHRPWYVVRNGCFMDGSIEA